MDYQAIAKEILKDVGGKDNIVDVTHCYTRLRFVLKDTKQANKEALLQTEGVISVVESGGQYQVVLGNKVAHVYNALEPLLAQQLTTKTSTKEKNSLGNRILNTVAAIFTPVVPAIAASGMLKGILAIAVMVANNFYQVDLKPLNTYIILSAASDALFYFMPVILGYSAAKVFKTNEYIAMVIGATLCYPIRFHSNSYYSCNFYVSLCATLFGKSYSRSSKNYYGSYAVITFNDSSHFIIIWTDRDLFR